MTSSVYRQNKQHSFLVSGLCFGFILHQLSACAKHPLDADTWLTNYILTRVDVFSSFLLRVKSISFSDNANVHELVLQRGLQPN